MITSDILDKQCSYRPEEVYVYQEEFVSLMNYNKEYTRIINIICWISFFYINLAKDGERAKPI
jgi:hypothetical protein